MEDLVFIAEDKYKGIRLDSGVADTFCGLTRSYVKKLIEEGAVYVNGKREKASYKLCVGDEVTLSLPEPTLTDIIPQNIPLNIVYEDDSLLVINKQAGMVVHPAAGNYTNTLVNALLYHCQDSLSTINGVSRPGIVHRIDKDTTGLLVVAKGDASHLSLSEQLKTRSLKRRYAALVHNNFTHDSGTVNKMIARSQRDRKKMAVVETGGREAITNYSVAERFGLYTLINCDLDTGRTHQIRVHMKYIGHPVVGDKAYGVKDEEFNLEGQLLHAERIGFVHPKSQDYMEFSAPIPDNFQKILDILRNRQTF